MDGYFIDVTSRHPANRALMTILRPGFESAQVGEQLFDRQKPTIEHVRFAGLDGRLVQLDDVHHP